MFITHAKNLKILVRAGSLGQIAPGCPRRFRTQSRPAARSRTAPIRRSASADRKPRYRPAESQCAALICQTLHRPVRPWNHKWCPSRAWMCKPCPRSAQRESNRVNRQVISGHVALSPARLRESNRGTLLRLPQHIPQIHRHRHPFTPHNAADTQPLQRSY